MQPMQGMGAKAAPVAVLMKLDVSTVKALAI